MVNNVYKHSSTNLRNKLTSQASPSICKDPQRNNNNQRPTFTTKDQPKKAQTRIYSNNTNKKKKKQKKAIPPKTQNPKEKTAEQLIQFYFTAAKLTDDDTVDYVYVKLLENPFDEDTREFVCGILMEAL